MQRCSLFRLPGKPRALLFLDALCAEVAQTWQVLRSEFDLSAHGEALAPKGAR